MIASRACPKARDLVVFFVVVVVLLRDSATMQVSNQLTNCFPRSL